MRVNQTRMEIQTEIDTWEHDSPAECTLLGTHRVNGRNHFVSLVLQEGENADWSRYDQKSLQVFHGGRLFHIGLMVPKPDRTSAGEAQSEGAKPSVRRPEQTRAKFYRFVSPSGEIVQVCGLRELCADYGLSASHMSKVVRGRIRSHKGWSLPTIL
jgi:hypothetical protein